MADQRMALSTAVDSPWVRWHNSSSSKAPVAQLDRAFGYEPKGRTFESCRAHQSFQSLPAAAWRLFHFGVRFGLQNAPRLTSLPSFLRRFLSGLLRPWLSLLHLLKRRRRDLPNHSHWGFFLRCARNQPVSKPRHNRGVGDALFLGKGSCGEHICPFPFHSA